MNLTTELHGDKITIMTIHIASYGRPPQWRAEFTNWPSIDAVEFGIWPDAEFYNVKRRAQILLAESERSCSID